MTGGRGLIAAMCVAEVLTMAGVFAFPALLPVFFAEWNLSNTEAGWIAGIYFAAYAVSVPVLVALTDRVDARIVYIGGALLAAASSVGFAIFAEGFWTGLMLRALAGVALAATYMPGLKVLVDRYQGSRQSRAVALYTSSFSLGTAGSFLIAGEITAAFGWRWAFAAAARAPPHPAAIARGQGPGNPPPQAPPTGCDAPSTPSTKSGPPPEESRVNTPWVKERSSDPLGVVSSGCPLAFVPVVRSRTLYRSDGWEPQRPWPSVTLREFGDSDIDTIRAGPSCVVDAG